MSIFNKKTILRIWENHKDSLFFLFFSAIFSAFLPVWITFLVMFLTGSWQNVADLWNSGAFFIYSATLLASAIYMMHGYPKKNSSLVGAIYIFSWILILFSAVGFTVAIIPSVLLSQTGTVDPGAIKIASFILVFLALAIIYYAHYYDARKPELDRKSRENVQKLMGKIS